MNIFGNIKYQENINNDANFQSFPSAMLLLFRQDLKGHQCSDGVLKPDISLPAGSKVERTGTI